jgi:phosphoribosyl-dephospho-CoA transferase
MTPLRRHQLVWLDEFAWFRVLATASSSSNDLPHACEAQTAQSKLNQLECLEHWAQQRWPLVVTRQAAHALADDPDAVLALGLSAPARWGRQAIAVSSTLTGVMRRCAFPSAAEVGATLPCAARPGWVALCQSLAQLGVTAHVYGSHGWQQLTGLDYVHPGSDIDLLLAVATPAQADLACARLMSADMGSVRIDGELAFGNGTSVAWREWQMFRSGQAERILVKHLTRSSLEDTLVWASAA